MVLFIVLSACERATTKTLPASSQPQIVVDTLVASPEPEPAPVITANRKVSTPLSAGISTLSPEEIATDDQYLKERSLITIESNGQTVTIGLNSRFFVFLDNEKYPIKSLTCEPECLFMYISNGSLRGPDSYPIYYEPVRLGECTLQSGDFSVTIIVQEPTPDPRTVTPLPTYAPPYP
jgi:hypothetical protein